MTLKKSELIINPDGKLYHIGISKKMNFPKRIMLVGDPKRVEKVASQFDNGRIDGQAAHREFLSMWGKYKDVPIAVMGTGIGTDNTEIALIELHALNSYDPITEKWDEFAEPLKILRVGTCGSPQSDIKLGSLAITSYAIGLDSTGLFYLPKKSNSYSEPRELLYTENDPLAREIQIGTSSLFPPIANMIFSPYVSRMSREIVTLLTENAKNFEVGITTSAPGFFAPQGRIINGANHVLAPLIQKKLADLSFYDNFGKKIRAINTEMESSLLGRLGGEVLGFKVGALCSVIANRAEGEFISTDEMSRSIELAIRVGLETLIRIS